MDVNSTFEKTGIKCKVLQEIIQLAKKNCVEKVILFGSRARGDSVMLAHLLSKYQYPSQIF